MRIVLDPDACVGHGRCYAIAPEAYDADDQGHCVVRAGAGAVPGADAEGARRGADNCPEGALVVSE